MVTGAIATGTAATERRVTVVLLLLIAVTVAVYLPIVRHEFIAFDDPGYVFENAHVRDGLTLAGMKWAFTTDAQSGWTPLTWWSHMAAAGLFGVDGEKFGLPAAGGHHVVDLLLHVANTLLLFLWLRSATGAVGRSALVAALFAVHPLHVEAVAWVSARKDTLSTLFGFAALLAYVHYARRPGFRRYLSVVLLLALGLLCKPMLVTWPCVLLLLDLWPLRRWSGRSTGRLLLEKLPFVALAVAASAVTWFVERPALHLTHVVPLGFRIENALAGTLAYLGQTLWPVDLAVLYPYPHELSPARVAAAALLVVVALGAAFLAVRRRPWITVGALWFLGTLVPVIGVIQIGLHQRADRFTYVPLVGLFIVVAWGLGELVERRPSRLRIARAASVAAVLACAAVSSRQVRYWSDTITLFRHACDVTVNNGWAHRILGTALLENGRLDEAAAELQLALRVWPADPEARNNLGLAMERQGRLSDALTLFGEAARLDPGDPIPRRNVERVRAKLRRLDPGARGR